MQNRSAVGVCSWSLQAATVDELAVRVAACGVGGVQLALDPVRTGAMPLTDVRAVMADSGIAIHSGMMGMLGEDYTTLATIRETGGIVPDATWASNLEAARANARIAADLGIKLVTFHAGFVPHDDEARRAVLLQRLRALAEVFAESGASIALETGQEDASTLRALLDELRTHDVGVNFDPANMILYGMGDPVEAVPVLARFIRQVHVKDAIAPTVCGEWGTEVPVGAGDVRWYDFFRVLRENDVECDVMIEREAGAQRVEDVRAALALLKQERVL